MGRELLAAATGDDIDGRLVFCVDSGNGAAGPAAVQQVCVLRHHRAILEVLGDKVVSHVGGQAEEGRGHEVGAGPVVCGQHWIVWPEVVDLESHVGHVLVLFFFCRHFVWDSQRSVA